MPPSPSTDEKQGSGSASADGRREPAANGYDYHHQRPEDLGGIPNSNGDEAFNADYSRLMSYPGDDEDADYYGLLGLARNPPPKDSEIRSAYRNLTLSFHPDKQPAHMREAAERQFNKIHEAYETLIDPHKRTVYDLLGAEGVREEWGPGGAMGRQGEAERQQVGVKVMTPEEFRRWFLKTMQTRERKAVDTMVRSRGTLSFTVDASDLISVDEDGDVYLYAPSLRLSEYGMAYSFKTPIPNPASWFRGKSEPTEEVQEDNNPTEASDNNNLEMVINASVAGKLQQGKQKFVFEYEDGTQETREVPIPLALIAKNLTLGANINYALGDVAGRKGLGNKRPFSFLNDTNVSASALLLPAPALAFSFAKAIALVPKANPFNVNLSTTFSGSILQRLPEIGVNVSRAVGERKIAFCSWSSGTLLWPSAKPEELIFTQLSKFQLGLLSFPARPTKPTGPIDGQEDEEYREIRRKEREANKAREAFQFQVEASPAGGSLSFNYSRNVFSGKPADELVRSEWSPEGHYGPLSESEPRSVRLEISTTIGLDLALGWSISGVRQVGEFTRMGLDIGVEGMKGLVVSISWRRLGQRINIPIAVCPVQMVNMDVAAIAVIFPWVAYCAVEFGFIRPRQRRECRQAVAQRRKKLEKLIPQKRAESQQTIELMTEQVRRRQAREEAQGGLVVTKAEYGYIPPTERRKDASAEARVIDVTVPIAALVDRSQLIIPRETVKFHIVGFYDPAPLLPKKLKVWYQFNGKQHFVEADDSEGITCPMRSHLIHS